MFIEAEDVGGTAPRNLYLPIADGKVQIKVLSRPTGAEAPAQPISNAVRPIAKASGVPL
jgi:hypothetical protein